MGAILKCLKGGEIEPLSNENQLNQTDKAILDCKNCRDNLKKYIKRLENNSAKQKNIAKDHLKNKNREKAKMALNLSKFYQKQADSSNDQLYLIENQIMNIETTKSQQETFKVLDQGNKVLRELQKEVNIEKWEKIQDDFNDLKQNEKEIGDFLKRNNVDMDEYEEGLNTDLEKLMKQEGYNFDSELLPEAGNKNLPVEKEKIEKPLDKEKLLA